MAKRKKLQELTIKDNFMFGAVMVNEDLCKELLELILGFSIEKIIVDKEKSIIYHPEYKGTKCIANRIKVTPKYTFIRFVVKGTKKTGWSIFPTSQMEFHA